MQVNRWVKLKKGKCFTSLRENIGENMQHSQFFSSEKIIQLGKEFSVGHWIANEQDENSGKAQ